MRTFYNQTEFVLAIYLNRWGTENLNQVAGNGECKIFTILPSFEVYKWQENCCFSGVGWFDEKI